MADVKEKAEQASADVLAVDNKGATPEAIGVEGAKLARQARVRGGRVVPFGVVHIRATFNNTIISVTDSKGGVIAWSTSGRAGFKGSRKSTAFAASVVAQEVARQAVGRGMQEVEVRVQGPGAGRESAIRALQAAGLNVSLIKDVTPMPHNGCRARKRRRV
jgi:small subunit ribosomal protein S11